MIRALAGIVEGPVLVSPRDEVTASRSGAQEPCPPMFEDLVRTWADGFDSTGTAHWESNEPINPNKGENLRALSLDRKAGKVLMWIEAQGGLTRAVHCILGDEKLSRLIAVNIAQVGSVLFNDITLLLEHFDPFEDE